MKAFDWGWLTGVLDEGFSPRNVAMLLWAGLAALTVSLTILARTRWGQAQPLSKCMFLSLYAHFLFGGYAYTTQVILARPKVERDVVIRLTSAKSASDLRDDDGGTTGGKSSSGASSAEPWERAADVQPMQPDLSPIERREAAPAVEPTRTASTSEPAAFDLAPSDVSLPSEQPERPSPDAPPPPPATMIASGAAPASEIDAPVPAAPQPREMQNSQSALPGVGELARAEIPSPEVSPLRRPDAPELPQSLIEDGSGLQRLANAIPAELASAAPADRDDLTAAFNKTAGIGASAGSAGGSAGGLSEPGAGGRRAIGAAVAALPIPRRLGDGAEMPDVYRLRVGEGRALAAQELGATPETESAVEAALRWFAAHQEADGSWNAAAHGAGQEGRVLGHDRGGAGGKGDTAITGLALLCFLGAGHTHLEGPYAKNVQHGLEYLLRTQHTDGDLSGEAEFYARMYCHGMASLALSESLALTGDRRLTPFVERSVAFSSACQHPTNGGWRYRKGDEGDMSQFGWQVMSLKSADLAGIPLPQTTRDGMYRFLRGASSGTHGGLASYRRGERVSRTMTAEALACRYFLDGEPGSNLRREAVNFLLEEPPQDGRPNFYYWYYGTLALFQTQDANWKVWNAALQEQLLARQSRDGDNRGSWNPDCIWGGYGGRVYTTAMGCLCLEVYYRYLPITSNH